VYHHAQMLASAAALSSVVCGYLALSYSVSDAVSTHVMPRNSGALVSGVHGVHETPETLSSSFALRHHAWMQANAVSQRAA
jgi:hypothetical protein